MSETAEKKPARAVNLAHPVVRGIFGLAGVVFVVVTVIDIKDGSSIGAIVRSASIALAGLVMAVFARAITERSERKQSELPGWPDVVTRNPLKQLFGCLWIFGLLGAMFFLDLVLARPLATGGVFLAGAVSIFLSIYVSALLHGRFRKFVGGILANPAGGINRLFRWQRPGCLVRMGSRVLQQETGRSRGRTCRHRNLAIRLPRHGSTKTRTLNRPDS